MSAPGSKSASRTVYWFACYQAAVAAALLLLPAQWFLDHFFGPMVKPVWIEITGAFMALMSTIYVYASHNNLTPFIRTTVPNRLSIMVVMSVLVGLGWAKPSIFIFGFIDVLGAAWTYFALKADARQPPRT
jgi:hypothetical protein